MYEGLDLLKRHSFASSLAAQLGQSVSSYLVDRWLHLLQLQSARIVYFRLRCFLRARLCCLRLFFRWSLLRRSAWRC